MCVEFDVDLTEKDLFRFNLYQIYHGSQGILSILIALILFVIAGVSADSGKWGYLVLYAAAGIVMLFYVPASLRLRVKHTMKTNPVLSNTLHLRITEEALYVVQKDQTGELPLDAIYKVIATKRQVLIYSNRVNAYIIPREQLGEQFGDFKEIMCKKLPPYRVKLGK